MYWQHINAFQLFQTKAKINTFLMSVKLEVKHYISESVMFPYGLTIENVPSVLILTGATFKIIYA